MKTDVQEGGGSELEAGRGAESDPLVRYGGVTGLRGCLIVCADF